MKKIRTITFHSVLNYGAVIQTYALVKYLTILGHDVKLINYQPIYFLNQVYRPAKGLIKTINKYKKIFKFYLFRKKFIPTTKLYIKSKNLNKISASYFFCGSDQIWNKKLTSNKIDEAFFLNFVSKSSRRIAYAASAGDFVLDMSYLHFLNKFYGLGVREESLCKNIKKLNQNLDVKTVVDPCLLLDNYDEICSLKQVPKEKFILSYCVGSGDTVNSFEKKLKIFKKKTNLPIYHIGSHYSKIADYNSLDLSPTDWVGFFSKAEFIITSSFHGLAMSIKLNKQFAALPHAIEKLNNRQNTLLNNLNLSNRVISNNVNDLLNKKINYNVVNISLKTLINNSKNYINYSIR